jgi:hypothetical protein
MNPMKKPPTSAEYDAFKAMLDHIVGVPCEEMKLREAEYKAKAALNPTKRGPKPRGVSSPDPVDQLPA